ncbi:MAG: SusC/RagA family TonB-linked outer membrane protein [Niabella sp.]|nr:SusC/RagA family TonB-linked outer membrane protein [Niabella sp.]
MGKKYNTLTTSSKMGYPGLVVQNRKTSVCQFSFTLGVLLLLIFSTPALAQSGSQTAARDSFFTLTGSVRDESGAALSSVTIKAAGRNRTVVSDNNGNYRLPAVSLHDKISFTSVGFASQELPVSGSKLDAVLLPAVKGLEEVVVTDGYRINTRIANVSAIGKVDGKVMENKPFASFQQTLQGRVAGVSIVGFSGQPGSEQSIRIRGLGSMALSSNPLIVIDGMIVNTGNLANNIKTMDALTGINQNDIESINVLKDAAATSLYGSRGSNGVIVITTKAGKSGKTRITADVEYGSSKPMELPKGGRPLNASQYAELFKEALANAGNTPDAIQKLADSYGLNSGKSNDWYNLVTRTGKQAQYNVGLSGGSEKTRFYASAGYFKQDATTIGADLNKKNFLLNLEHKINKRFTFSTGINASNVGQNTPYAQGFYGNPTYAARVLRPFQLAYNDDGSLNTSTTGNTNFSGVYNPLVIAKYDVKGMSQTHLLGNAKVKWNLFDNLFYTSYISLDYTGMEETTFLNAIMGDGKGVNGRSKNYFERYFNWLTRNQLDYRYDIPHIDNFSLNATAGYEAQKSNFYLLAADGYGFPSAASGLTALSNAATPVGTYGQNEGYSFTSLYGIASANYKNRIILNGSYRRDGSSRFAVNNRYANFFSVGGAWNIDQEAFFQKQKVLSSLKLRSSYGITGNAALSNYAWMPLVSYSGATGFAYNGIAGQQFVTPGNIDLKWERSKKTDAGIDMGFVKDRFSLVVDYYFNNVDGLIQNVATSLTSGFSGTLKNVGAMVNKGWEFTLNGNVIQTKKFYWNTNFNIAFNKNKITSLDANTNPQNGLFYLKTGYNFYTYYMKEFAGVDPQNGDPLYYKDNTHKETTNKISDAAYSVLNKQANPKYFGGFSNNFNYKGINLAVDFTYNVGNYVYGASDIYLTSGAYYTFNKYLYIYEHRWTTPGQVTDVPKYAPSTDNSTSTYRLYKGDYIRLRNLSLGYDFATLSRAALLHKYGINKLNLYVRATNLATFLFDNRLPFDPEVSYSGFDSNNMPKYKTFTIGINVGF